MLKQLMATMRWSFSIGNKFFQVVPGATLAIVLATLVSQLSTLLAFLLPLKILMLLGSSGIPRYFPSSFANVDRDFLVLILSISAVAFYALSFAAERIIDVFSRRGAGLLLGRSKKISLFENQEELASRSYQRYSRSLAGSVFLLLSAVVMAWLYPALLVILMIYITVAFLFFLFEYSKRGKLAKSLAEAPGRVVSNAANIGFLLSFGFMVVNFLTGEPPGLLVAIVSLILMRQGLSRITGLVNDIKGLYSQRLKLNALFFHGQVLINESSRHDKDFWSLLKAPQRDVWMLELIKRVSSQPVDKLNIQWWQLGGQDVAAFRVLSFNDAGVEIDEHLVKLFNINRSSLARHEEILLSGSAELPAFPLVAVEKVEGLHCHVFKWVESKKISLRQLKSVRRRLLKKLMISEPEESLVSQFMRSRPPIWQRIDKRLIERLSTVAETMGEDKIKVMRLFKKQQSVIKNKLKLLPLTIVNPDSGPDCLHRVEQGFFLMAHWGRWSLEPVGAGWPIQPKQLDSLIDALEEAREVRQALREINSEDVRLAAFVYELEKLNARQDFVGALGLIPKILQCLENKKNSEKVIV